MEENLADALKMAGSFLLFVIGLSIAIFSFSQARSSIDIVLSYSDRESLSIENDSRFYYLAGNDTSRYVGKETIIPAIYRAYKENYKIIFEFPGDDYYLFEKKVGTETKKFSKIDLEEQSIGSDADSRWFLNGIIYGKFDNEATDETETITEYQQQFGITVNSSESLYEKLTELENTKNIKESLGTYYKQDVGGTSEGVADVNKTEKRVITYTFE